MLYALSLIAVVAACYFLGSVPFGLVIAKAFCGIDPREAGSKNVGATNVARLCGFKWGLLTLLCDLLKGFSPVYVLASMHGSYASLAYPAALAVVCGHMFSYFLKFKGGKGVATTVGVFLALAPLQLILAGVACILVIWRTGFVSAGSLTLVAALPAFLLVSGRIADMYFALIITALVVHAHKDNIRRLMRGEEKSWMASKQQ